jgi:hypothetical protein
MDDLKQLAWQAQRWWAMRVHDLDWEVIKSPVSIFNRKVSKAVVLLVVLSISLTTFVLFPTAAQVSVWETDDNDRHPSVVDNKEMDLALNPPNAQLRIDPVCHPQYNATDRLPKEQRFVVVIPVTEGSPELCKTIMTALALGYPAPIIVNWGVDYHTVSKWTGGRNLPKIPGFLNYLDGVMHPEAHPSERLGEDDLVLMVDAFDVWFQLPAETMLRRYHEINRQANERLCAQWDGDGPMPMKQTIIAGSGKNCHPRALSSGSNLHCDELPESPLRPDLYGPLTEKNRTQAWHNRPRYINGGLYMGPAGDMRRLFRRATEKMQKGIGQGVHLFSEQGIPGEVLGEQEVWRAWRRNHSDSDVMQPAGDDNAEGLMERDLEYHFGLDYAQELSAQTFWTDQDLERGLFDGGFVTFDNQSAIDASSAALNMTPPRLTQIPDDVLSATNPLMDVLGRKQAPSWRKMAVYADYYLANVPVILHHNGFKDRRVAWWDRPWFHGYLRQLVTLRLVPRQPPVPLGTAENGAGVTRYWAPSAERLNRRPRMMKEDARERLPSFGFQDLCHFPGETLDGTPQPHWWEEVFRDAGGPFEDANPV